MNLLDRSSFDRWYVAIMLATTVTACASSETDAIANATPTTAAFRSLSIAPRPSQLVIGDTVQFTAWAHRSAADSVPVDVSWSASGGAVSSSGQYIVAASGMQQVRARYGAASLISDSMTVATLSSSSVQILPADAQVAAGDSVHFVPHVVLGDGSVYTPQVNWSASDGSISASGVYVAGTSTGTAAVTAMLVGASGSRTSTPVTIVPTLIALSLTPTVAALKTGQTVQLTVMPTWSDKSTTAPAVTWTTTGGTVSVSGLFTAGSTAGTFVVTARQLSGLLASSATITVTAPPATLSALYLNPDLSTLAPAKTQQFYVAGKWSDGTSTAPSVTFVATGGTITSGGLYTAGAAPGTFRVIATQTGGTRADTSVIVIPGTPLPPIAAALPAIPGSCAAIPRTRTVNVATSAAFKAALLAAIPGDLIQLADGTYGGSGEFRVRNIAGNAAHRITLCGSRNAIINAGSLTNIDGLNLQGANYWDFVGFTITRSLRGVYAEMSSNNRFMGLAVHGIGQEGIHLRDLSRNNVIQGNTIYDTGNSIAEYGEGIYIGSVQSLWCTYTNCAPDASDSTLIDGNTIGPDVRAEHVDIKEGTTGGELRNNVLDGRGMVQSQDWVNSWFIIQGDGYRVHNNTGAYAILYGYKVEIHAVGYGNNNFLWANTADVRGAGAGFRVNSATTGNVVKCDNVVLNAGAGFGVTCQ